MRRAPGSNEKSQPTIYQDGHSSRLYGNGGLRPTFVNHQRGWGQDPTPMFHYRGADLRAALDKLRKEQGDAYEGIQMQLVNPVTGKPVYPTLDYKVQLLRPGEELKFKRETCSTFIVVMAGSRLFGDRRPALRLGRERHHGGAEFPVAPPRQYRQERRGALHRVRLRAAEEYRPVPLAG